MFPRPAIITRRALVSGAAALAMAPSDLHGANAAGWNASDKSARLAISNLGPYMGANTRLTHDTTAGQGTVRSTWNFSSGKWIIYYSPRHLSDANNIGNANFGVVNGSASLAVEPGGSGSNGYGLSGARAMFNGSITYTMTVGAFEAYEIPNSGTYRAIAINADASPKKAYWYRVGGRTNGGAGGGSTWGWSDWTGAPADPTNPAQGTDISSLGTPLYIAAGGDYTGGNATEAFVNFGGWPPLTDLIPIPSGYSMPDANYPFSIPSGVYTLSKTNAAGSTLSNSNMRLTTTSGSGIVSWGYSSAYPTGRHTVCAYFFDTVSGSGLNSWVGLYVPGNADANQPRWNNDGTTTNLGGVPWAPYVSGDTCYLFYDQTAKKIWGTKDGATFYGNGGASPNPFSGTNGADVSGITNIANACPGAVISSDYRNAFTFNAGRLTDSTISLSAGWTWLDPLPSASRRRGFIMP